MFNAINFFEFEFDIDMNTVYTKQHSLNPLIYTFFNQPFVHAIGTICMVIYALSAIYSIGVFNVVFYALYIDETEINYITFYLLQSVV